MHEVHQPQMLQPHSAMTSVIRWHMLVKACIILFFFRFFYILHFSQRYQVSWKNAQVFFPSLPSAHICFLKLNKAYTARPRRYVCYLVCLFFSLIFFLNLFSYERKWARHPPQHTHAKENSKQAPRKASRTREQQRCIFHSVARGRVARGKLQLFQNY